TIIHFSCMRSGPIDERCGTGGCEATIRKSGAALARLAQKKRLQLRHGGHRLPCEQSRIPVKYRPLRMVQHVRGQVLILECRCVRTENFGCFHGPTTATPSAAITPFPLGNTKIGLISASCSRSP